MDEKEKLAFEERLKGLEARLAEREKAFWKRSPKTALGTVISTLLLVGAWIYPLVWGSNDPSFPRFVHRDILMTDVAIGSMLAMSSTGDSGLAGSGSPRLYEQIKGILANYLKKDTEARSFIRNTARNAQAQVYMGSRTFQRSDRPNAPISCQLSQDVVLRGKLVAAMPMLIDARIVDRKEVFASDATQQDHNYALKEVDLEKLYSQTLENWCRQAVAGDEGKTLAVVDPAPLILTYRAKAGDSVLLRIKTDAVGERGASLSNGYRLVEYGLSDGATENDPASIDHKAMDKEMGVATIPLQLDGPEQQRFVSIALNDKGRTCLAGTRLTDAERMTKKTPGACDGQSFIVNVAASITVVPKTEEVADAAP